MSASSSSRLRPFRPVGFGRYTLLYPLSVGGMGQLFLGRLEGAQGFQKLCVIKKIKPELAKDPEFLERFGNEAKTLVKLSHGSVAQVLDMGMVHGEPFLALEYVDGKDLRRVLARAKDREIRIPLTFALFVMARVLDALSYVHRKQGEDDATLNLVHRDVSPQNILTSYEGEVKIIDFGLAKSVLNVSDTHPNLTLGTYLYMAPEQVRHQHVDKRTDLYAAGICLYELISGRNPFEWALPGEAYRQMAQPHFPSLLDSRPDCPRAVEEVVMKALAIDPAYRFQSAEEFRARLHRCLLDLDPVAGPESVSAFMRRTFEGEYRAERNLLSQLREEPAQAPWIDAAQSATVTSDAVKPRRSSSRAGVVVSLPPPSSASTDRHVHPPGSEELPWATDPHLTLPIPPPESASSRTRSQELLGPFWPKAETQPSEPITRTVPSPRAVVVRGWWVGLFTFVLLSALGLWALSLVQP